ncbi:MAG: DUF502 domain-containing protein [Bacteroidetes bacterium]|nr:DUF502 domain-containing protein [Bacteroidota bacterium]
MTNFNFREIARKLLSYFLRGLLIVIPVSLSLYIIFSIFTKIDNIIPLGYGLGFIVIITSITIIGYIGNMLFGQTILVFINDLLERTPGVKYIYNLIKDFMEAFVGEKRKFTEPVMIEMQEGVYKLGFVTQKELSKFGMTEYMSVYCPKSYGMMGDLLIVKKEKVRLVDKNATKTMSFIVSGGVTEIE